jgi:hypothetical protein
MSPYGSLVMYSEAMTSMFYPSITKRIAHPPPRLLNQ